VTHGVLSRVIPESSRQSPEPSRNNEQYTLAGEQLITRCHGDGPWPTNDMKDNNEDDGEKGGGQMDVMETGVMVSGG
jgi:hypothetical protein